MFTISLAAGLSIQHDLVIFYPLREFSRQNYDVRLLPVQTSIFDK